MIRKTCPICKKPFETFPSQDKTYCSRVCSSTARQGVKNPHTSLHERFWSKVNKRGPRECWPWIGKTIYPDGRGKIRTDRFMQTSNYVAFILTYGPLQPGEFACHSCDSPPCCNPAHLFRGTHQDNMKDCQQKNRRIHWDLQQAINLRAQGKTLREIATIVGATPSSLRRVFLRRHINTKDRRHGTNSWPVDEAIVLFQQGISLRRIAKRYHIAAPSVRKALIKRGIL